MQLRRLANLERSKILEEYEGLLKTIAYLEDLLANKKKILFLVKEEIIQLKNQTRRCPPHRNQRTVRDGLRD